MAGRAVRGVMGRGVFGRVCVCKDQGAWAFALLDLVCGYIQAVDAVAVVVGEGRGRKR